MSNGENIETVNGTDLVVTDPVPVSIARAPDEVLNEARRAAVALKQVLDGKKKKVRFNGEQYLEFEDWQTVGKFYGVTVRVVSTSPVEIGDITGFEARAEVIDTHTGQIVSSAEAMCLNDEVNWKKKPLFQLRSMAQTRASAKALRNVLAWVVVLAGYKPTPAEEMDGVTQKPPPGQTNAEAKKNAKTAAARAKEADKPNDKGKLAAKASELETEIYGSYNMNARKKYGLVTPDGEETVSFRDATFDSLAAYVVKLQERKQEKEKESNGE